MNATTNRGLWIDEGDALVDANVGIGTDPIAKLHISDSSPVNHWPSLLLERTSVAAARTPRIGLVDTSLGGVAVAPVWMIDNLTDMFRIFRQPNISTVGATYLHIDQSLNIGIGGGMTGSGALISGAHLAIMNATGNVGVGTTAPTQRLHINAVMRLEPLPSAPACNENGMLYVDTSGALCYCDGISWSSAAGPGSCT
jgi:hypothetical protein